MTREEAKELLPIIKAYADGKTIQTMVYKGKWVDLDNLSFNRSANNYRIKSESKYRPFESADECWNEMLKHQPFGWVKGSFGEYAVIDFIDTDGTARHGNAIWDFKKSFNSIVFADGSPFGIKEGGEE